MMKKQLYFVLTTMLMTCFASTAWAWSGSGTADDPYLITNTADWNTLATNVSGGNTYNGTYFKLTGDITVSEMVGTDGNRFAGTFNGNGHTLTFNKGTAGSRFSEQHCGPFRYISGATIKCLHIAGTIYTSNQFAGVVGRTGGTNHFIACRSSLTIDCSKSGDGTNGGFIGVVEGTRTYFTNCLFDGQLLGSSSHSNGGFCGWSQNGVTLTNCLFAPSSVTFSATSSKTFSRGNNVSDSNCYYKQQYGDAQGTNAGSMSNEALQEALGIGWEISGGKVVPIISLRALTGDGTEASPYLIGSATDWDNLAINVALGETYSGKFFKLTNNITVSEMVGLDQNNRFAGTFDGDGYTLTFNKGTEDSRFAENFCAPFRYTRGASLKNLIIEGTIYTSAQFAAVLGNAHGDTYINNCRSSIVINSSKSGDGTHGGFIGVTDDGHNHFTGCVFNGKMVGSNTNSCGGFVGWTDAIYGPSYSDFTNCLFAPAELTVGSSGSATFSRGNGNNTNNITCINCYYASSFGTAQGEQVYSVVGVSGMTVAMEGTPTATYNVSGLTFYGADKGFIFDGTIYGGNGDALSLNLSGSTGYKPSAGTLTGAGPYVLTMADANTIIYPAATCTAPTAINPTYTGVAQALVNAGTVTGGTMYYSLDNSAWDAAIPTGTAAGDYTVYYKVIGDATHADYTPSPNTVAATIAKAPLTITADEKWIDYGDELMYMVATYTGFVNGEDAGVVSPAVHFSSDYTQGDNAGTYTITPYGAGAANYEISYQTGVLHVNKVASTITTTPTAIDGLVANGSAQTLINAGEATGGEMQYSLNNFSWSTELPTGTDANTYTVYYKVVGDINHTHISAVSFEVTIAAPAPAPAEDVNITPNEDPDHAGVYYSTFFDSANKYALPAGVEAYIVTTVSGDAMQLQKVADAGQTIPAGEGVILKASVTPFTLTLSDADAVSVEGNRLEGSDISITTPANCYVLAGNNGVGFYHYTASMLNPHKAYIIYAPNSGNQAPRRLRFAFETATGVENVQGDNVQSTKVIENGVLYIIKNGVKYNAMGQVIK